jgi:hypothetical protein
LARLREGDLEHRCVIHMGIVRGSGTKNLFRCVILVRVKLRFGSGVGAGKKRITQRRGGR